MGQTCCNFQSKDPNALNVNGSIKKMNGANKVTVTELTPKLQEAFNFAKLHEKKVIKV